MEIAPVPGIRTVRPTGVPQGMEELAPTVSVQAVRKILEEDSYSGSSEGGGEGTGNAGPGSADQEPEQGLSREQLRRARGWTRTRARKVAAAYGEPAHPVDFYV